MAAAQISSSHGRAQIQPSSTPLFLPFAPSYVTRDGQLMAADDFPEDLADHEIAFKDGVFSVCSPTLGWHK